jgi:hypothetical protein
MVFWSAVLLLCLFGAMAGFAGGKYWLGNKLRDIEARTPKNPFQAKGGTDSDSDAAPQTTDPNAVTPPEKAEVKVETREPNEGERSNVEREHDTAHHKSKKNGDHEAKSDDNSDKDASNKTADGDNTSKGDSDKPAHKNNKSKSKSKNKEDTGGPVE